MVSPFILVHQVQKNMPINQNIFFHEMNKSLSDSMGYNYVKIGILSFKGG